METKLDTWGNSLGLRIPRSVAKELNLAKGDTVAIVVREGGIVLTPARSRRSVDVDALLKRVTKKNRHRETEWGDSVGGEIL